MGVKLTGSTPVSELMTSPAPFVNWMALKSPCQKPPSQPFRPGRPRCLQQARRQGCRSEQRSLSSSARKDHRRPQLLRQRGMPARLPVKQRTVSHNSDISPVTPKFTSTKLFSYFGKFLKKFPRSYALHYLHYP